MKVQSYNKKCLEQGLKIGWDLLIDETDFTQHQKGITSTYQIVGCSSVIQQNKTLLVP